MSTTPSNHITLPQAERALDIEYALIGSDDPHSDLLVFLHEGLGSVALWKDWPQQVCAAAGCTGLVFSRYAYGSSTPKPPDEKWPMTYHYPQATDIIPALLQALGLSDRKPFFYGHSDGATIALLHAALRPAQTRGIIVAAPHIFVEDTTLLHIEKARDAYLHGDLRERLKRYHQNPDSAFWAWADTWLDPDFRTWTIENELPKIKCPVLAMQGVDDEYGTLAQILGIQQHAAQTELRILQACGHTPHKDHPERVMREILAFMRQA